MKSTICRIITFVLQIKICQNRKKNENKNEDELNSVAENIPLHKRISDELLRA